MDELSFKIIIRGKEISMTHEEHEELNKITQRYGCIALYPTCFIEQFESPICKKIIDTYESSMTKAELRNVMRKLYSFRNGRKNTIGTVLIEKHIQSHEIWEKYKSNGGGFTFQYHDGSNVLHTLMDNLEYFSIFFIKYFISNIDAKKLVNEQDNSGDTPLHRFFQNTRIVRVNLGRKSNDILKLLFRNEADPLILNTDELLPIDLVSLHVREQVLKIYSSVKKRKKIVSVGDVCCICLNREPSIVMPCGHVCFCNEPECQKDLSKCPVCRDTTPGRIMKLIDFEN